MESPSTALSLVAALLFGAGDFCGGLAARKSGLGSALLLSQLAGAALLLALAALGSSARLSVADLPLAAVAGIAVALGLAALYKGIAEGIVAVVAPVSALLAALVPAVLGALRGESPAFHALAGAALCLPAVALLSWDDSGESNLLELRSSLVLGAAAGLLLGIFYAAISLMRSDAGLWPLLAARVLSLLAVLAFLALRKAMPEAGAEGRAEGPLFAGYRRRQGGSASPWAIAMAGGFAAACAGGAFDATGNVAFMAATRTGPLMIVSVVTSLYPALTVVLARIFFAQRIGKRRATGLALALVGVCLIGLR